MPMKISLLPRSRWRRTLLAWLGLAVLVAMVAWAVEFSLFARSADVLPIWTCDDSGGVLLSPSGKFFAVHESQQRLSIWDTNTGSLCAKTIVDGDWLTPHSFSADERFFAFTRTRPGQPTRYGTINTGTGQVIECDWNPEFGKALALEPGEFSEFSWPNLSVTPVLDGKNIWIEGFSSNNSDPCYLLIDLQRQRVRWSQRGRRVAPIHGQSYDWPLNRTAFSADGRFAAFPAIVEKKVVMYLFDLRSGHPIHAISATDDQISKKAPFSPDGELVVVGNVEVYDIVTRQSVARFPNEVFPVFSPDGRLMATFDQNDPLGQGRGMAGILVVRRTSDWSEVARHEHLWPDHDDAKGNLGWIAVDDPRRPLLYHRKKSGRHMVKMSWLGEVNYEYYDTHCLYDVLTGKNVSPAGFGRCRWDGPPVYLLPDGRQWLTVSHNRVSKFSDDGQRDYGPAFRHARETALWLSGLILGIGAIVQTIVPLWRWWTR